ncbi:MAG: DUF1616 domain-containing protein [Anaerolineae bacterium]
MSNEFILILFFGAILILLIALGVQGLPAPLPMLRLFLGLAYVLYVPGYALQAALFPRADDLDGPERLALSFGLSVAVIPPLALLLDALPWGIRLWPIVISEATLIALSSVVALLRRRRLPEEERFVPTINLDLGQWWAAQTRISRLLYAILALALLGAGVAATAIIVTPKPGERLTEFYILGPEGLAENYPREAVVGFPVTVTVGIANREGVPADYWVGAYCGNHLIGQSEPLHLEHGQTDEWVLGFVPIQTGDNVRIDFYLYRDGGTQPYRSLRLWLKVKAEAEKQ